MARLRVCASVGAPRPSDGALARTLGSSAVDVSAIGTTYRLRTGSAGSGLRGWPASMKLAEAASPDRWWRQPSCSIPDRPISGLRDSKLLTPAARDRLHDQILERALAYALGAAQSHDIDRLNIHRASLRAMRDAVTSLVPLPDFCPG